MKQSVILAAGLLFAAAACGEAEPPKSGSDSASTQDTATSQNAVATAQQAPASGPATVRLSQATSGGLMPPPLPVSTQGPPPLPNAAGGQPLPQGAVHLQQVDVIDPSGFEKPMVAFTTLVPVGWQTQGGVTWLLKGCVNGFNINWMALSPDGRRAAEFFTGTGWEYSNFSGAMQMSQGENCIQAQLKSARDYLNYLVQATRPGARVLAYRDRPDMNTVYQALSGVIPLSGGGEIRSWTEAGEILIGYQVSGVEMREAISAVVTFSHTRMQGLMGEQLEYFKGGALPGFAFRAPDGELDFRLADVIYKSQRSTPEWQKRVDEGNKKVATVSPVDPTLIGREGAKRSEIIASTADEIRKMSMGSTSTYNNVSNGMQASNVEAIRGVETYNDAQSTTGTVELSNQYNSAWRMQDGSYVLTNDPSFNPYVSLKQDGVKLEPTP